MHHDRQLHPPAPVPAAGRRRRGAVKVCGMSGRSHFKKGNRDGNEDEIKAVLRAAGVKYLILSPGQGADLLLVVNPVTFVEVKSLTGKLTETEKAMKWDCEEKGIPYHVVRTAAETAAMLNSRKETK
jgi:hypothetical protein